MGVGKIIMSALRFIFFFIDRVVFWGVEELYNLFLTLSQSTFLTYDMIQKFSERIYLLLGLFMLFKVSFSIITYVINPDDIAKEGKGVASILKNVIISLILLVLTPYIFQMAYDLQIIVLKDNVIGNIVIGEGDEFVEGDFAWAGRKMGFTVFATFFNPNEAVVGDACKDLFEPTDSVHSLKLNSGCQSAISRVSPELASQYSDAFEGMSVSSLTSWDFASTVANPDSEDPQFLFEYKFVFSTICGVVMLILFLNFCFDIAIRSVKLGFLQMIAPIPIISYIDPKSGKDGIFKKWVKQCTSTYLSLFIRLLIIYFAVYLISTLNGEVINLVTGNTETGLIVNVFIIFGVLMFAKQMPKLLEDLIPGLKVEGSMGLNNLKTGLGALGAVGAGVIGGAATGGVLGAVGGAVSGLFRGGAGIVTGKKPFDAMHAQANANMARFQRNMSGVGSADMMSARMNKMFGIPGMSGSAKQIEGMISSYEALNKYKSAMEDEALKDVKKGKAGALSDAYLQAQANIETLKNTSINRKDYASDVAYNTAVSDHNKRLAQAYSDFTATEKRATEQHLNNILTGSATNAKVDAQMRLLEADLEKSRSLAAVREFNGSHANGVDSYKALDDLSNSLNSAVTDLKIELSQLSGGKSAADMLGKK